MNNPNSMLMDQLSRCITQALVMGGDRAITNHQATNRLEEIVNCLGVRRGLGALYESSSPIFIGGRRGIVEGRLLKMGHGEYQEG